MLEGNTRGLEPEDATTSNASSDQQQLSSKGFQLICDPYKPVAMVLCIRRAASIFGSKFQQKGVSYTQVFMVVATHLFRASQIH